MFLNLQRMAVRCTAKSPLPPILGVGSSIGKCESFSAVAPALLRRRFFKPPKKEALLLFMRLEENPVAETCSNY